jgi:hypothetical protein
MLDKYEIQWEFRSTNTLIYLTLKSVQTNVSSSFHAVYVPVNYCVRSKLINKIIIDLLTCIQYVT